VQQSPNVGVTGGYIVGNLTALAVKAAMSTPGTYQDGDGLFLKIDKRGGADWLLRLQRDGKRQEIGLDCAHAKGWRSTEAPSGSGSLKAGRGLPKQSKQRENRKAMPYAELPRRAAPKAYLWTTGAGVVDPDSNPFPGSPACYLR